MSNYVGMPSDYPDSSPVLPDGDGARRAYEITSKMNGGQDAFWASKRAPYDTAVCAAKGAALAQAKLKLAIAITRVIASIARLGDAAALCESDLGTEFATGYRRLWEQTAALDPAHLGYLATCLDKIKYLLEALLGLEKVILAKTSYAIVLEVCQ
jgi:hypothetical protein